MFHVEIIEGRTRRGFTHGVCVNHIILTILYITVPSYSKEIEFVDSPNIKKEEIKKYFDQYYDKSIFIIPIKEISNKISKNKWVDSIYIKSDYNDKIIIEITEVIPLGIFYHNDSYFLFDANRKIIDKAKPKDFLKLNEIIVFIFLDISIFI